MTPLSRRAIRVREENLWGMTLRVGVWHGNPDRTPLFLFNGIGAALELLAPFAAEVGDLEVVAFDVPGTGGSSRPPLPYRLWTLAVLAGRLLDRLGYGRVDVLGVSWGGALAQQFALQNPARCRRLVLAATAPGILMVPPKLSVLTKLITPRRYNDAEYREQVASEIYGGRADAAVVAEFRRTSRIGYLLQQTALAGWTSLPWLPLLPQPTLVLAGEGDRIIPLANARLLTGAIRRSQLRTFPDGHLFLISSAAAAGAAVRGFLAPERIEF